MTASFAVFVQEDIEAVLEGLDNESRRRAASRAINKIAKQARAEFARRIIAQVNLPSSYVSPSSERLYVSGFASPSNLEAEITARGRATSLARFVTSSAGVGRKGVRVSVARGRTQELPGAFLMKLRSGKDTDSRFNMGLAVRLRPGQRLRNTLAAKRIAQNLYLLYGPSVAQVFENNAGTGEKHDYSPEIAQKLHDEFVRLLGV